MPPRLKLPGTPETATVKVTIASLCLTIACCASQVHAGQWTIEETDENYIVEFNGAQTEKPAEKPAPPKLPQPPGAPAATPAPASPPPATVLPAAQGTERAAKIREQNRRERTRPPRPPGDPEDAQ